MTTATFAHRAARSLAAGLVLAILGGCSLHQPGFGTRLLMPLPVIDAKVTRDGSVMRFKIPAESTALVKVGPPPTPVSVLTAAETAGQIVIPLFESLSDMRLVTVDKASGATAEHVLPGTQLTYGPLRDVKKRDVVWIPGCLGAVLYRYDAGRGTVEKVLDVPGETHLFGLDQDADGTLYLGTHPNAKVIKVRTDRPGPPKIEEIKIKEPSIARCRYVRDVFVADGALFLGYMAPGILVRHDLETGKSEVLLRTTASRLQFRATPEGLRVWSDEKTLFFDRRGQPTSEFKAARPGFSVSAEGMTATATWDGRTKKISLLPRDRGMRITCFEGTSHGWICGASYWNAWMFRVDPATSTMTGLGAIPNTAAEFFTIGEQGGEIFIPQYQGDFLMYDPARPWSADPAAPNPRLEMESEPAHFGLSCVTDHAGRLVFTTTPNFHQRGGMLGVRAPGGRYELFHPIGDELTLSHLVSRDESLFAGTVDRIGMGLRRDPAKPLRPPAVVRVTVKGKIREKVDLDAPPGTDVVGLVSVSPGALLAATPERLHVVNTDAQPMTARRVTVFDALTKAGAGEIRAMTPYGPEQVLVLTKHLLASYVPSTDRLRVLARLSRSADFMVVGADGSLWLADSGSVYCIQGPAMKKLIDAAGAGSAWDRRSADSSLDFELRAYIGDYDNALIVCSDLRFAIFKALKDAGIEVPFPQRDLHIRSDDTKGGHPPA